MITNEVINKDIKKTNNKIWISLLVIILGIGLFFFGEYFDKKLKKDAQNLNDVIESKKEDKENIYTYLDVKNTALLFAGFDDKKEYYYFVTDGTYVYIAYMDEATYKENFENNEKDNIRIYGYTYTTTKDVKKIAIDTYNEMYELKGDEALTVADFSSYFGTVYMNMTGNISKKENICIMLGFITFITGMVMLIAYFIKARKYKKYFKITSRNELNIINSQLNSKDSFNYKDLKLFLTDNYIVSYINNFYAVKYEDVLWIYEHIQRVNGFRAYTAILVMDKNFKLHTIVQTSLNTKAKKESFDEIIETISNKNENILMGYTKENRDKIKNMKKKK